jgi:capsular exopolysaccharide synthesis family protein
MAQQSTMPMVQEARQYLAMLHKRRGLVLTCVGVSLLVATLYNYTTRPLYQATAQILIDRSTPSVLPAKELVDMGGTGDYYQTQYELLRGRSLAEKVVKKLNLQTSAEFKTGPLMSPLEQIQRRLLGKAPQILDSTGIPLSPAAAAFRSRLRVEPVPGSRLVNLRFTAYEGKVAMEAVNALAQLYIEQSLDYRFTTSSDITGWLSERVSDQEAKVKEAERALQQYREREGLVNVEERQGLVEQKLSALNQAVMAARMQRIQQETLLSQMRGLSPSQLESFPMMLQNQVIQTLRSKLRELQSQQSRLSETLGEKHPEMLSLSGEIRSTEEKIQGEMQALVSSLESAARTALSQENNLQSSLEATKQEALELNRKAIEYGVLKREVETGQQLYQTLTKRSKETGLETELRQTNIRIVEKAELPRAPFSPQKGRNYQIALLIGLALGIALTILFEHLDNTVKTPDDVKSQLGVPFLGMVPHVEMRGGVGPVQKLMSENPQSAVAEAYRLLRTNLIFSSAESAGKVLLVSSASPGEGKTTTVANVSASLAQNGARVLAVDSDLRRPTLHQHFAIHKSPGLSDLIVGKCQASEAVQVTRFKGLHVLPCGYVPPNPAELLGSAAMKEVLRALKTHYDWVLLDTAPVLAMADTPVICPYTDGLVLVVGAEVTSRPSILRAIDQIRSVGGKVLGVVLNKVNLERNSYYYSQYYGEYYRSYYAEAGARREAAKAAVRRA